MAVTFEKRLLRLGVTLTPHDSAEIDDRLTEAFVELLADLREVGGNGPLWSLSAQETIATTGITVASRSFLRVHVDGYRAHFINPGEKDFIDDGPLPERFVSKGYMAYVEAGSLYVTQTGSTAPIAAVAQTITLPAIVHTDSSIDDPVVRKQFYPLLAYRTALDVKRELNVVALREALPADTDLSVPTLPTLAAAPSISYTSTTATTVDATTISIGAATLDFSGIGAATLTATATTFTTLGALTPYVQTSGITLDFTDFTTAVGEDDTEMMDAVLRKLRSQTEEFLANVQDELNTSRNFFDKWVKDFERFAQTHRVENDYAISRYSGEIQRYRAEVEQELAEYSAQLTKSTSQAQITLQEQIEEARQGTQVNLQNAAATLSAAVDDYAANMRHHAEELSSWRAQVEQKQGYYGQKFQAAAARTRAMRQEIADLEAAYVRRLNSYVNLFSFKAPQRIRLHRV